MSSVSEMARAYLAAGFQPIPVQPRSKDPGFGNWQKLHITREDVPRYFANGKNIGLLLGKPSRGLVDIDLDSREARSLGGRFLPPTAMIGGRGNSRRSHFFYRSQVAQTRKWHDPEKSADGKLKTIVELRSTGSQTLVCPSVHPDGDSYLWDTPDFKPAEVEPADLIMGISRTAACALVASRWGEGSRHDLALAVSGMLLRAGWSENETTEFILAAATSAGDRELRDRQATVRTTAEQIRNGERATGVPTLAALLGDRVVSTLKEWLGIQTTKVSVVHDQQKLEAANIYGEPLEYLHKEVDEGFAQLFVSLQKHQVRFCSDTSRWFFFDGKRWIVDEAAVKRLAICVSKHYARLALDNKDDPVREKELHKIASRLLSDRHLRVILNLAAKHLTIKLTDFDPSPHLLNVLNGSLNLQTGDLQQHSSEDLITCLCPVEWRTDVGCDRWTIFLEEVFCDEYSLIMFAQKLAGLSLVGEVRERILILLTGGGANGKSVFLNTLAGLLGPDYARVAAPELLLGADTREQSHELAGLRSMRLVIASETGKNRRLNEALIKRVTGRDVISARALYCEAIQFKPQFLMWLSTNNRPTVSETTNAIWDRIKEIPFDRTFAPEEQDKDLDKTLAEEYSGILKWAFDGYQAYLKEGLSEPDRVKQAVENFRSESDQVGNFIDQRCEVCKNCEVESSRLYIAYREWCEVLGETPEKQNAFGRRLTALGFSLAGEGRRRRRVGVRLADAIPDGTQF